MSLANRKVGPEEAARIAARLRVPAKHGATRRHKVVAAVMMVLAMAGLIALTAYRSALSQQVRSPLAEKIADADRVSYYLLEEDGGPSFRLGPNDRSLKLITHLMLPMTGQDGQGEEAGFAYEEDAEYAYGGVLELFEIDGEEPVWSREFNIRTRQSKAGGDRFGWRQENSFMLDPVRELTDDRLTRIRLPEAEGKRDRLLRLRLIASKPREQVSGLVRVYVREERPVDDKTLRELALAPGAGRDLVDHVTYHDWAELSEQEREFKLRYVWRRLSAEGEIERDYEILSVYETGFRLPRGTKAEVEAHPVVPTRWLAFNVIGPAELELRVAEGSSDPRELQILRFGLWGEAEALPQSGASNRTLAVPEGVYCYVFSVDRPHRHEIEIEVVESEHRVWMTEAERPLRVNDDGNEMLEPDLRRIPVVRLGPGHKESPRWEISGPDDIATRMLRFDVRVIPPFPYSWWLPPQEPPTPTVDYCFYDEAGAELGCEQWHGRPAVESHFEGIREGGPLATRDPDAEIVEEQWYEIAEPQTLRLVAPEGAASIVLRQGDQSLLIRGYGFWPEVETIVAEPWREHTADPTRWRYPPLDTRTWFPIRPVNFDALQDDEAIVDLYAQIRLMPRGPGGGSGDPWYGGDPDWDDRWSNLIAGDDGWDPGPWVTVEPRGRHRRRSILERLDEDAARRLRERWDPSLFTEVVLGRKLVVDLGASGPGAPELHWQLD
ncbi:MAG: hypothetical protein KC431_31430, partial [Myxococcales bacterium]|nr:hypothetical protein [Myxococcales bacterium]